MKIKEVIGIDVSKSTIDVCIHTKEQVSQFENSTIGFKQMLGWIVINSSISKKETLYVFEHTGIYSYELSVFLDTNKMSFYIASGLDIKRSVGIVRGKDDEIDARRIAVYGYRLKEEIQPSKLPLSSITQLKSLFSLRTRLVKQRAGFKATLKEQKRVYCQQSYALPFEIQQQLINSLTQQIVKLDKAMSDIIKNTKELKQNFDLITSIKGLGKQTAIISIIFTENFTKFETWRKFASYCGVAPFPYSSGSSIRRKTKVSHLAHKQLKTIFNLCAVSAIQHNTELKQYYHRRVAQGKNKMSTINIIRNKLIARMFAVVYRKTPYVDNLKYAA